MPQSNILESIFCVVVVPCTCKTTGDAHSQRGRGRLLLSSTSNTARVVNYEVDPYQIGSLLNIMLSAASENYLKTKLFALTVAGTLRGETQKNPSALQVAVPLRYD
jgi:hypothetical protein